MGQTAVAMQEYLGDANRFSDLFNAVFFGGEAVIEPQRLMEQSERYVTHPKRHSAERGGKRKRQGEKPREEYRDIKKILEDGTTFRIFALEAQSYVDYAMPLRCMEYDVQEYLKQLRELRNKYNRSKELKDAEWLSGIKKEDRLAPVYTLCLYHGEKKWDGPLCLSDMMDFGTEPSERQLPFADYPMKLYRIHEEEDFEKFHTDLREVFQALCCRDDRQKLENLMQENAAYQNLTFDTIELMAILLDFPELEAYMEFYLKIDENGEERYDMCKALADLRAEERNIGQYIGQEIGQQIGQELGEKIGERIGETGKTVQIVRNMIARGYSDEDICAIAECDPELVQEVREENQQQE